MPVWKPELRKEGRARAASAVVHSDPRWLGGWLAQNLSQAQSLGYLQLESTGRVRLPASDSPETKAAEVRRRFITATVREKRRRSHHKGATGRVRTGDQRYPVLCHCQLGQDIPIASCQGIAAWESIMVLQLSQLCFQNYVFMTLPNNDSGWFN